LPYFARRFDAEIKGLDYSSIGCEQTQEILRRTGYEGEIVHADLFDPPPQLIGLADVVFSWGLVEHFTDTAAVAAALHRLARPGGRVITVVPNMAAAAGRLQRWINREIYDLHVPLDRGHLLSAFESVAAKVEFCDYFMPVNFWVVNPGPTADRRLGRLKAMVYACAKLITVGAWQLETRFRTRLPSSRTFSPYIVCVSLEATAR
jgi:SAM-dependent methyltransferase